MTPKEKASELVNKFCHSAISNENQIGWAKMNAIKCVDEIINDYRSYRVKYHLSTSSAIELSDYWVDVKKEIEEL